MQTELAYYAETYVCTVIKIIHPKNYFIALDFFFTK